MDRKEAIEVIKKNWPSDGYTALREALEMLVPELKESDDERIRTRLIALVEAFGQGKYKDEMLAYLENLKEYLDDIRQYAYNKGLVDAKQKSAEWSDSVAKEMFIKALERAVEQTKKGYELSDCDKHSWWEDFKAYSGINPAEWSEEDERMLRNLLVHLEGEEWVRNHGELENLHKWQDFLKSLPERFNPQPHWKPSEEQIGILGKVFAGCQLKDSERDSMVDLFYHLKDMI